MFTPGQEVTVNLTVDNTTVSPKDKDLGTTVKLVKYVYAAACEKNEQKNPQRSMTADYDLLRVDGMFMQACRVWMDLPVATMDAGATQGGQRKNAAFTLKIPQDCEPSYIGEHYAVAYGVEVVTKFPAGQSPTCKVPLAIVPAAAAAVKP